MQTVFTISVAFFKNIPYMHAIKNSLLILVISASLTGAVKAQKVEIKYISRIVSNAKLENLSFKGDLNIFTNNSGTKKEINKLSFCVANKSSWFKLDENDGKDHIYGFDGKNFFARHGSDVTFTREKVYSNYWRLDYLLNAVCEEIEWTKTPLMLSEALAGVDDYHIKCEKEGENFIVDFSKFIKKMPTGNDNFDVFRFVIDGNSGRILEKNHLVHLKSNKVDYYVPIYTTVFHYDGVRNMMMPTRVRVLRYDMSKTGEPNDFGIRGNLEKIPIDQEIEYKFTNLKMIKDDEEIVTRYSVRKGDSVLDIPLGGISYEVE